MRARLEADGMRTAADASDADVLIVNTCTVTRRADQEARQLIRRLARENPGARLVVTGCYAQRAPEELRALPGVGLVLGIHERERIAEHLAGNAHGVPAAEAGAPAEVAVGAARAKRPLLPAAPLSFGRTRALLKIQDGCDSFCSYCIVPHVRGRGRSLPLEEVVVQGARLVEAGFHEIVLTGADLGSYGRSDGRGLLPELIRRLLAIGPAHRIRLSSIEPNKLDPEVIAMLGAEPRLCRHLHLPLQSGSDAVLEAMRRPYRAAAYGVLLDRIMARGTVAVGADVIVGFPGEGRREFEETLAFLRDAPLAYLHVFRYSARPGTLAALEPGAADTPDARARSERLRDLGNEKRALFLRSVLGSGLSVLAEAGRVGDAIVGRSDLSESVLVRGAPPWPGFLEVAVSGIEGGRWTARTG